MNEFPGEGLEGGQPNERERWIQKLRYETWDKKFICIEHWMNGEDVREDNVASVQAGELGQGNAEKDFNAKIVSWYLTPRQWSQQGSLDKEVIMLRFIRSRQLWRERWITLDWSVGKESGEQGSFITPKGKIAWELSIGGH